MQDKVLPASLVISVKNKFIVQMTIDELYKVIRVCGKRKYHINSDIIKTVCYLRAKELKELNKLQAIRKTEELKRIELEKERIEEEEFQLNHKRRHEELLQLATQVCHCHKRAVRKIQLLNSISEEILPYPLDKKIVMSSLIKYLIKEKPTFKNQTIKLVSA